MPCAGYKAQQIADRSRVVVDLGPRTPSSSEYTKNAGTPLDCKRVTRVEYPRPDEATSDTSYRCYLRGPDGVGRLIPSGTWGNY